MADRIDVLNENGLRTGEVLSRKEIHRRGKWHRAVHLYLFNTDGNLLLQRRAMTTDHYQGLFAISAAGHVDAGESSFGAVRRETQEELGLNTNVLGFDFIFSHKQEALVREDYIDRQFNDVFICRAEFEIAAINFSRAEVSEIKLVSMDQFQNMVERGDSELVSAYRNECRELANFLRS